MLNSSFLQTQAEKLAQQAYVQADPVAWLYRKTLGYDPSEAAAKRANAFIDQSQGDREKAIAELAHALMASTEFLFLE